MRKSVSLVIAMMFAPFLFAASLSKCPATSGKITSDCKFEMISAIKKAAPVLAVGAALERSLSLGQCTMAASEELRAKFLSTEATGPFISTSVFVECTNGEGYGGYVVKGNYYGGQNPTYVFSGIDMDIAE
jgi:hypothetical protein